MIHPCKSDQTWMVLLVLIHTRWWLLLLLWKDVLYLVNIDLPYSLFWSSGDKPSPQVTRRYMFQKLQSSHLDSCIIVIHVSWSLSGWIWSDIHKVMAFLVFWINCNLQFIQNLVQDDPPMQIRPDMDGSSCLDTHKRMIATFVVKRGSVLSDLQYSVCEALK